MVWLLDDIETIAEPGPEPRPVLGPEHRPEPGPELIEANYRVSPAQIEQAIERTGQKYVTDMAALYDRVSTELGAVYEGQLAAKDQALAAKDETIAELRRRAAAAEAERERLTAAQAASAGPGAQEAVTATPAGLLARWGRWWRG